MGENGDWYVSVAPEHERDAGRAVRICTSGGAAKYRPSLPVVVHLLWQALGEHQ